MKNGIVLQIKIVSCVLLAAAFSCGVLLTGTAAAAGKSANKPAGRVQFQDVAAKARLLSESPYHAPGENLSDALKKIGYDQWRDIRFKPVRSLWAGQSFSLQFFHPGFLYQQPVSVHSVEPEGTFPVPFAADLFDYTGNELKDQLKDDYGFAGFRVHYPLNTPKYADELVSFLGASYFRALGRDLAYGLSARGLAVNTAEDGGEEFPLFREFWILRPAPGAKVIRIYALLDSNSVTGAYEFVVTPGVDTEMSVNSVLFIRQRIQKLGIAPLTSMFFYGENAGLKGDSDFRPEVHDSDGLQVHVRSGEWLWHPLVDPSRLLINAFGGEQPEGFGLIQRDVNFDHYQDLEARYDRRPSVWVTPKGDWGKGRLELVQLPTETEYNDNIVAYWVPEREFNPGDSVKYAYTLSWHSAKNRRTVRHFVEATRIVRKPDGALFFIDFSGGEVKSVLPERIVTPDVWISKGGRIMSTQLIRNPVTDGWRLVLQVQWDAPGFLDGVLPNQKTAVEFRAFLKDGPLPVTETWSYTFLP